MSISNALPQASSVSCAASAETLATRMSMPPSAVALSAMNCFERRLVGHVDRRAEGLDALGLQGSRPPPSPRPRCGRRSRRSRPRRRKCRQRARPMPLLPPVTTARRPFKPRSMLPSLVLTSRAGSSFRIEAPSVYLGSTMLPTPHPARLGQEEIGLDLVESVVGRPASGSARDRRCAPRPPSAERSRSP